MTRGREGDTLESLRRAGVRAAYHLLRAGVEGLKAVEAVLDELGQNHREGDDTDDRPIRQRIDIE